MNKEVKEIKFYDGKLLGIKDENGQLWLGVKRACLDIGLSDIQARSQVEKIKEDLALKINWRKFPIVQKEGNRTVNRPMDCINERVVTLWLAKIHLTPSMKKKSPKAVEKLLKYQLEAADVLHQAFYETADQKQALHEDLGLKGEILDLKNKVSELDDTIASTGGLISVLIQSSTINTYQQQKLYKAAKDRINQLLDGAHSTTYKKFSKSYFINLWNDLKERYNCSSYKDLNPIYFDDSIKFIGGWDYSW